MSGDKEPLSTIIVCAGPPICELQGDTAVENQEAGCPICKRIDVFADGTEREYQQATN